MKHFAASSVLLLATVALLASSTSVNAAAAAPGAREYTADANAKLGQLQAAIRQAQVTPDPQAFQQLIYGVTGIIQALNQAAPDWRLLNQFDAFFYVSQLLPMRYQLNYVKRH